MSIDKLDKTAVVMCTYHRTLDPKTNTDGHNIIRSFYNEEFSNFYVLFDDHYGNSEEYVSKKYGCPNVCLYNDNDFEENGFNKPINLHHHWGSHQNPKYFYAHFRMLTFYLRNPDYEHYWFFDDETFIFSSELKVFKSIAFIKKKISMDGLSCYFRNG